MSEVTLGEVARTLKLDINFVRDILTEKPGIRADKETLDMVFKTARRLGYDFRKLKVGKRMNLRKEVVRELIQHIKANPKWGRKKILEYLTRTSELVERVHKRVFAEEFGK